MPFILTGHRDKFEARAPLLWKQLRLEQSHPGDECSICLGNIEGKKFSHTECSLSCCESCLKTWLNTQDTCPTCRRSLKRNVSPDGPVEEVAEEIISIRQDRPEITQHYVVNRTDMIRQILRSQISTDEFARLDFWEEFNLEDSNTSLVRQVRGWVNVTTRSIDEMIRQKDEYGFSKESIRSLFFMSRIAGVSEVYLTQFEEHPHLGFWKPMLPQVRMLQSSGQLHALLQRRERQGVFGELACPQDKSTIIVPLPTKAFARYLRSCWNMYPDHDMRQIQEVYELAANKGISHWALVHLQRGSLLRGNPDFDKAVYAVPWPSGHVEFGYSHFIFPGLDQPKPALHDWEQNCLDDLVSAYRRATLNYDRDSYEYFGEVPVEEFPAMFPMPPWGQHKLPELMSRSLGGDNTLAARRQKRSLTVRTHRG